MCAILDNDVAHEVFSSKRNSITFRGTVFLKWIEDGKSVLIVGGKLTKELYKTENARDWIKQGLLAGSVINEEVDEAGVKLATRTSKLKQQGSCHSNDPHVIALAQISGARILYTKDGDLMKDFRNSALLNPKGKIYSSAGAKTDK